MVKDKELTINNLLENGQWQEAFIHAKNDMENSLNTMYSFLIENYEIYEKHMDDDPEVDDTAGCWYDAFINASTTDFLPSIKNLMIVFGKVINKLDSVDAVLNYDVELEEIRDTINSILEEGDVS